MYLRAIQFIGELKIGPFHEHSPVLYDVSGVPLWSKVNSGMLKMYIAEVIKKYPVVQHIPFGTLLPFEEAVDGINLA
ncbi:Serine/threonine-protein phosphatase 2A activator 1 [Chytridiales sp. JEL 0842]|nr:Serine/threonine-protein phosphatase 2A activator 1 [Chytridiales sp. JEL 0842]